MKTSTGVYEFGPFRLEIHEQRLLRNGQPVPLRSKVFATLRVLVENQGKLVSKDDLMNAVWPDSVVEEGNLALNLTVLRKALGEKETGRQHVQTVPGRGYRFVADVKVVAENTPPGPAGPVAAEPDATWEQRVEAARRALVAKNVGARTEGRVGGHVVGREQELAQVR